MPRIDREAASMLLEYNPNTGVLLWKKRPLEAFSCLREWSRWNNRYGEKPALSSPKKGYLTGTLLGRFVLAHRIAWLLHYGTYPDQQIDHINGDRTDNRITNLRLVDSQANNRNRKLPRTNTSGIMGVARDPENRDKWRVSIAKRGKGRVIGRFDCLAKAIDCRKAAEAALGYHPNHGRRA